MLGVDSNASMSSVPMDRFSPCHQSISWSKNGIICYALAGDTGPNLNITFLENTDGKNWQLAPSQGLTIRLAESRVPQKLVLVQWSNISTDLAVFDELGNFYILLAGVGLLRNKPNGKAVLSLKLGSDSFPQISGSSVASLAALSRAAMSTPILGIVATASTSSAVGNGKTVNSNTFANPGGSSASRYSGAAATAAAKQTTEPEAPSYELTSYNHTEMIYRDVQPSGPKDVLQGTCVAFKWLAVEKPQIINKPARWSGELKSYVYGIQQYRSLLLAHPILTKQACLAVRHSGIVNLYYQGEHKVEYHKLSVDLGAAMGGRPLQITTALIGFTADKKIVITAYDSILRMILTYSLTLDWGFLVASALRQSKDPHYHTPKLEQIPPSITVTLVHQMKPLAAISSDHSQTTPDGDIEMTDASDPHAQDENFGLGFVERSRLVLIDILLPYHAQAEDLDVLITYEHFSGPQSHISFTTHRYRYQDVSSTLANSFSAIGGSGNPQTGQLYKLALQDKLTVPGQFRSVSLALSDSVLVFILTNGSVVPVSRATWRSFSNEHNPDEKTELKTEPLETPAIAKEEQFPATLSTLFDCGFTFPKLPTEKQFAYAISPNMTCVVHLNAANTLSLANLEKAQSLNTELTSIGLAHTHAHACYSNACSDDLMVLVKAEHDKLTSPAVKHALLSKLNTEAHCAINFHLSSFGKESVDKLLSNPPLQKLLLLQLVLSDLLNDSKTRDIAWVVLNLRFTSFGIMFTLSSIYRQMSKKKSVEDSLEDSTHRAECVYLLIGNVKWLIDFIVYINQELAQLLLAKHDCENSLVTTENSIALPVILCKIPRLFLMYALSSIGKTHEILKKLHKDLSESNKLFTPMKEALDRFFSACTSLPLKIATFEAFLRDCETLILKELALKLADRNLVLRLEQDLFCRGKIPLEYILVAKVIVERHGQSISRDSRLSELFFYDTTWIAVGPARHRVFNSTPSSDSSMASFNGVSAKLIGSGLDSALNSKVVGTIIRQPYSKNEGIDVLRKIFIKCSSPVYSGGPSQMGRGYISADKVRKCVRCRSISLVADPLVFESSHVIALWTMVFQRTCICGSAWVNCIYS